MSFGPFAPRPYYLLRPSRARPTLSRGRIAWPFFFFLSLPLFLPPLRRDHDFCFWLNRLGGRVEFKGKEVMKFFKGSFLSFFFFLCGWSWFYLEILNCMGWWFSVIVNTFGDLSKVMEIYIYKSIFREKSRFIVVVSLYSLHSASSLF